MEFQVGSIYESSTHGTVEFKGIDNYGGDATLHFYSITYKKNCYWYPHALHQHFEGLHTDPSLALSNVIKKVTFRFDHLGRLCLRLTETMPDGKKLLYYLKDDGSWNLYDPSSNSAEPLSNARFPELASGDPPDTIDA